MTTVAFDGSTMASDSRATDSDAGAVRCVKLFRKRVGKKDHLIGIAGDVFAAMLFVDWYGSGKTAPGEFAHVDTEEDFTVLVWTGRKLYTANRLCRLVEVEEKHYAIGSGAAYALAAMDCGKSAKYAVQLACRRDPYSAGPVVAMTLAPPAAA